MRYLIFLVLISCTTTPTPKDINQAYLMGCISMLNQVAFSDYFTEEQYDYLLDYYTQKCSPLEEL